MKIRPLLAFFLFSVCLVSGASAFAQEANTSNSKDGATCKVTSGPNKGKTGTYTDGGTWCERTSGGTECTDQQGNSKCSDALQVHKFPINEVAFLNGYFEAASSSDPSKLKQWEEKYSAKAKKTGNSVVITLPDKKTLTFDGKQDILTQKFKKHASEQ
jgi:hypothetical protein